MSMIKSLKRCTPYFILGVVCIIGVFLFDFSSAVFFKTKTAFWLCGILSCAVTAVLVFERFKRKTDYKKLILYFAGAMLCVGATFLVSLINPRSLTLIVAGFLWVFYFAVVLYCEEKLDYKTIGILIFIAGFVLRLGYIAYTGRHTRQHDVHEFIEEISGNGHQRYILWFFENFKLPDFDPRDIFQFYHPPLHHMIAGLFLKIQSLFSFSFVRMIENLQFLTLFYSSACMIVFWRILGEINIKNSSKLTAFLLIAFNPTFIIFSGSINNDILSITFMLATILYTIRWYKNRSFKNIISLALTLGLGMMTKLSAGLVSPAVAVVFLFALIVNFKNEFKKLFLQFVTFGVICIPLGLWWSVRNFVKFNMPLGYVPRLSETATQYIGNYSITQRLFDFTLSDVFIAWGEGRGGYHEHNVFLGLLKTSLFDENRFNDAMAGEAIVPFANILFWVNVLIAVLSFAVMVYLLLKVNLKPEFKLFSFVLYSTIFISYISFCFTYPHTCTMNIRYATPLIALGAMFIGLFLQKEKGKFEKILARVITALCVSFSVLSTAVYMLLAF